MSSTLSEPMVGSAGKVSGASRHSSFYVTFGKPAWERLFALFLLGTLVPVFLVVAAVIFCFDSPRLPIFFVSERLTKGRRPFRMIKFRTMTGGEVTSVGKYLRRTRIDELPQLVNVVLGDMSLIGPRATPEDEANRYAAEDSRFQRRYELLAGVTGLAQVKNGRLDDADERKAAILSEQAYRRKISLRMDLLIVFLTIKVMLTGHGAK